VVLQGDAVALDDHVWLPADHQRAMARLVAHGVAQLPTVGRHLGERDRERGREGGREGGRERQRDRERDFYFIYFFKLF